MSEMNENRNDSRNIISTMVLFPEQGDILLLDQALFSLANQSYPLLQVIIAIENGKRELFLEAVELLRSQTFADSHPLLTPSTATFMGKDFDYQFLHQVGPHRVFSIDVPTDVDLKTYLLVAGIPMTTGRFISCLDYNNVVYQHTFQNLVDRAVSKGMPITMGGNRWAYTRVPQLGHPEYILEKSSFFSRRKKVLKLFTLPSCPDNSWFADLRKTSRIQLVSNLVKKTLPKQRPFAHFSDQL